MWLHNRIHEIEVQAFNKTARTRGTGGLGYNSRPSTTALNVLWIPPRNRYVETPDGRYIIESVKFQVSTHELEDKSFEIIPGRTHIIRNSLTYRVTLELDSSYMNQVQLRQFLIRRKIPLSDVE